MTTRNQLLLAISRTKSGLLLSHQRELSLTRGDTVLEEDASARSVIFPDGALLSSLAAKADGRMVEVAALGCESAAGLLSCLTGEPETCRTVVRVGGPARVLPASILKAAAETDAGLRRVLLQAVRNTATRAEQELACVALHHVTNRLAKWLLLACARVGESRLPLTQDDMAVILGVQRTTLNASALQLKTSGAIRYNRGMVEVLDPERLGTLACECYGHAARDIQCDDPSEGRQVA